MGQQTKIPYMAQIKVLERDQKILETIKYTQCILKEIRNKGHIILREILNKDQKYYK